MTDDTSNSSILSTLSDDVEAATHNAVCLLDKYLLMEDDAHDDRDSPAALPVRVEAIRMPNCDCVQCKGTDMSPFVLFDRQVSVLTSVLERGAHLHCRGQYENHGIFTGHSVIHYSSCSPEIGSRNATVRETCFLQFCHGDSSAVINSVRYQSPCFRPRDCCAIAHYIASSREIGCDDCTVFGASSLGFALYCCTGRPACVTPRLRMDTEGRSIVEFTTERASASATRTAAAVGIVGSAGVAGICAGTASSGVVATTTAVTSTPMWAGMSAGTFTNLWAAAAAGSPHLTAGAATVAKAAVVTSTGTALLGAAAAATVAASVVAFAYSTRRLWKRTSEPQQHTSACVQDDMDDDDAHCKTSEVSVIVSEAPTTMICNNRISRYVASERGSLRCFAVTVRLLVETGQPSNRELTRLADLSNWVMGPYLFDCNSVDDLREKLIHEIKQNLDRRDTQVLSVCAYSATSGEYTELAGPLHKLRCVLSVAVVAFGDEGMASTMTSAPKRVVPVQYNKTMTISQHILPP